jgi:hypothetical protein
MTRTPEDKARAHLKSYDRLVRFGTEQSPASPPLEGIGRLGRYALTHLSLKMEAVLHPELIPDELRDEPINPLHIARVRLGLPPEPFDEHPRIDSPDF